MREECWDRIVTGITKQEHDDAVEGRGKPYTQDAICNHSATTTHPDGVGVTGVRRKAPTLGG